MSAYDRHHLPPICLSHAALAGVARQGSTEAGTGSRASSSPEEAASALQHIETSNMARSIWTAAGEDDGYMKMLRSVRLQFLRPRTQPSEPIILPPYVPSVARSRTPRVQTLTDNMVQYKDVIAQRMRNDIVSLDSTQRTSELSSPFLHQVVCGQAAETNSDDNGGNGAAREDAVNATATTLASLFSHVKSEPRREDGARSSLLLNQSTRGKQRRLLAARRASAVPQLPSLADHIQKLDIPTAISSQALREKCQRLGELEQLSRLQLLSAEKWERQVAGEMMIVSYVTHILKSEMQELLNRERVQRVGLRYEEERLRHELCADSVLATTIRAEVRALYAKQAKLARLAQVDRRLELGAEGENEKEDGGSRATSHTVTPMSGQAAWQRTSERSGAANTCRPLRAGSADQDAHAILQRYVREKQNYLTAATMPVETEDGHDEEEGGGGGGGGSCTLTERRSDGSRSGHGQTGSAARVGGGGGSSGSSAARRKAERVKRSQVNVTRYNTVNIADYVVLLNEDSEQRALLAEAEREARDDIYRFLAEERAVVLAWQRRRMHLERLMYWRAQRERELNAELDDLTRVTEDDVVLQKQVQALEQDESMAREQLGKDEAEELRGVVVPACRALRHAGQVAALELEWWRSRELLTRTAWGFYLNQLTRHEAKRRKALLDLYMSWSYGVVRPRLAQLRALHAVSNDTRRRGAIVVLQRAVRAWRRGQLGWRHSHRLVGREIQAQRNAKAIARGQRVFADYRASVAAQMSQLRAEIEAAAAAAQRELLRREADQRAGLAMLQSTVFASFYQQWDETIAREVFGPQLQRCIAAEDRARMALEVAEELARQAWSLPQQQQEEEEDEA